jgi:ABC-type Mn2+/Zn2+ transport system ATPase subunit
MSEPLVRLHGVTCGYGGDLVLSDVDLVIHAGSFVGVVGPSGSGKTTLLRALLGSVTPLSGTVERASDLRIGYVPQLETVNWNFPVTVAETVLMARTRGRRLPWASGMEKRVVADTLERLGLTGLEHRHLRELSGGQQQRVAIARALAADPQLLVLDEPSTGVDVRTRHELLHLLADLNATGLAVVLTTHDLNGIAAHLPHLACLNREVVAQGPARQVLTADVLERTYGAPMEVLEHGGMPVVVERVEPGDSVVVPMRRTVG